MGTRKWYARVIPRGITRRAKLRLHQGRKYTCPFCGYAAKDLRPTGHDFPVLTQRQVIGGGRRPSACYNCGSSDRERLVYFFLKYERDFLDAPQNRQVLHIAPEKRLSKTFLALGFARYECGDLFTPGYSHPDHVRNMNVLDLPFDDNTFDLLLCNHVLEHIETDDVAMKELHRVLAPRGIAILQVPISRNSETTFEDCTVVDPAAREQVFGQFDHVRIYGQDYPHRLADNGFAVERINLSAKYGGCGINPEEDLFVCSKSTRVAQLP